MSRSEPQPVGHGLLAAALRPTASPVRGQSGSGGQGDPFAAPGRPRATTDQPTPSALRTLRRGGKWPWDAVGEDTEGVPTEAELDRQVAQDVSSSTFRGQRKKWDERVPAKFRNAETEHAEVLDRLSRLRHGNSPIGLLVHGDTGTGKTFLAYAYAQMAIDQRLIPPACVTAGTEADLLGGIALAPYAEMEARTRELLNRRTRMLLLDDVGRGRYGRPDVRVGLFDRVLDWAWRNDVLMVVTTNLNISGRGHGTLQDWIGQAAYERLATSVGKPLVLPARDNMRRALAQDGEAAARARSQAAMSPTGRHPTAGAPASTGMRTGAGR